MGKGGSAGTVAPPVARTDFYWDKGDEQHMARRKAILKAHPEVSKLMGHCPKTKWVCLSVMVSQMCIAAYMSLNDKPWWDGNGCGEAEETALLVEPGNCFSPNNCTVRRPAFQIIGISMSVPLTNPNSEIDPLHPKPPKQQNAGPFGAPHRYLFFLLFLFPAIPLHQKIEKCSKEFLETVT